MGKISKEDIAGIWNDKGQVVCTDCMNDEDWNGLKEGQIITWDEIERGEDLYFCDLSGEQL